LAQRRLSTPARFIRRQATVIEGRIALGNGKWMPIDQDLLLGPLERALGALSWGVVLVAASVAIARLS
jgi:hypothetical protein